MAFTKYASLENAEVLGIKGSQSPIRTANLGKFADFEDYRTEDGYLYARIRAISSRVNKNHDGWPSEELAGGPDLFQRFVGGRTAGFVVEADSNARYGYSTFLGKPIFVDHHNSDPSRARGVIVDAKLHVEDHRTASELDPYYSSAPDNHMPPTWVELLLEIDAKSFPVLAKAIIEGSKDPTKGIDGFSMGCDVEKSVCNICKNAATSPDDYCEHVKLKGAEFPYTDPRTGKTSSRKSYEDCYGIKFFEISAVFDPADETALLREVRANTAAENTSGIKDWIGDKADKAIDFATLGEYGLEPQPTCTVCGAPGSAPPGGCPDPIHYQNAPLDDQYYQLEREHVASTTEKQSTWDELDSGRPPYRGPSGFDSIDEHGNPLPSGDIACPSCEGRGCEQCYGTGQMNSFAVPPAGDGAITPNQVYPNELTHTPVNPEVDGYGPRHQGSVRLAENPEPQDTMLKLPEPVDTLREESICPVCGSDMDEETCEVCGYTRPPEGFNNPDLTKAKETQEGQGETPESPSEAPDETFGPEIPEESDTSNKPSFAHVNRDMPWTVSTPHQSYTNPDKETPVVPNSGPSTDEPKDAVVQQDHSKPVTSQVRTAKDFLAVAGARKDTMPTKTADAASGAPAVATPDKSVDTDGVGGVLDASNEEASKADAQVDVEAQGGTGVEGVAADSTESVDQGDEHSKNIEAIPTKTFDDGSSAVERQADPVGGEVFPPSEEGVKASSWQVTALDSEPYPSEDGGLAGGNAVEGVQPADAVGTPDERVDVLDSVTTPENNSGPTTTWSGTDGNSVLRQQEPVTTETLEGSDIVNLSPKGSSTHIFAAFKLADKEVKLGLISEDQKYDRVAELEDLSPEALQAEARVVDRVKTAGLSKGTPKTAKRMPSLGRNSSVEKESTEGSTSDDVNPSQLFL